jgi:prevent-host-death family protein
MSSPGSTTRASIAEAKDNLPALVHGVEEGGAVEITRRGRPVAVLLSAAEYQRLRATRPGPWEALQAFRREHDLAALDVAGAFEETRDRSTGRDFTW